MLKQVFKAGDYRTGLYFIAAVTGLTVSAMLLVQRFGAPVFCAPGSGCSVVQASAYAQPLGIPLPILGVLFFLTCLLAASLRRSDRSRQAQTVLAGIGILSGVVFLLLQALAIGKFCQLCVVTDSAAIVLGVAVFLDRKQTVELPRIPTALLGFGALAVPTALAVLMPPPSAPEPERVARLPSVIEQAQTPGVVTIVEFIDFECPFCRQLHETLKPILAEYPERVRVIRFHHPLPMHPNARTSALAACCAEEQGYGDAIAEALFTSEDLSAGACETLAGEIGVDLGAYRECLESGRAASTLEVHDAAAVSARVQGLPTFFIGNERFVGMSSPEVIRASIDRAVTELR